MDIWIENIALCKENEKQKVNITPGSAPYSPPHAPNAPGVVHAMQGGSAPHAPKEELLKKNSFKKNTTTPTSSSEKVGVVVVSISQEEKEAAKALSKWIYNEAHRERKRKVGRHYEDVVWGNLWIIPIQIYEKLIFRHGVKYFQSQLEYMHREQIDYDKGINKKGIDKPEAYLKRACKENYADCGENKQEKK